MSTSASEMSRKKGFYFAELALRVLVIAFSVAGAVTMLTSNETVSLFGITVNATYTYSSSFRHVSLVVLVSGCSAATAIGFVGRFGQSETGWIPICDQVERFCDKVMVSIIISFVAAICLFLLTLMSAHKLKSQPFFNPI
ncbi:hypothetical protein SASPL_135070 [Salvia splendens]|uniref:CASP-like protein n=1 Tax=Salvia splendens TaxID=180675 RepID=A0A8X8WZG0_SALSN|nr:hypothetical protein SASPL_135070 [Salvia splendens]